MKILFARRCACSSSNVLTSVYALDPGFTGSDTAPATAEASRSVRGPARTLPNHLSLRIGKPHGSFRIIQIPMDATFLEQVDAAAGRVAESRSAKIRSAGERRLEARKPRRSTGATTHCPDGAIRW